MAFSDPRWLWALLALPLVLLIEWLAARRSSRALERLVGARPDHALLSQVSPRGRLIGALLRLGALALLIVGAAGPEWGHEMVRRGSTGSDVVLMVDLSASMDARDVAPSRLAEAKREALAVIDRLAGSRIGVVGFAGDAVRLCPLTLDRGAARLVLESASSATLSEPGSDLGRALRMGLRVLPGGRRDEQAIVLWTDGEDLVHGARDAIDEVARAGVRVFAVGVGTAGGDVIPVLDDEGRITDVKRDEVGGAVRSRLDETLLRHLARRTRGAYFGASRPGGELPRLLGALGSLARAARGQRLVERPVARFPWFAAAAAALLILERLHARRRRLRQRREVETPMHSERGAAAAAALLVALALSPRPALAQSEWAKGDRAYKAGRYAEAESLYALRMRKGAPPAVQLNRATARALAGRAREAEPDLGRLAGRPDRIGRTAGYNLGTVLGERREYDAGLQALRKVLEQDPADEDARWNYELLLRRREQERKNPPQPQSQSPQPKPSGGGGSGAPQPQPQGSGSPPPGPSNAPPPEPSPGRSGAMSRAEAEQLLRALEDMTRLERQRQRQVRVVREKRGQDW